MPIFPEHLVPGTLLNGCFCLEKWFSCKVFDYFVLTQYDSGNFTNLNNVMDEVKNILLTNNFEPDSNYIFPVKFLHGSDRSLNFDW